MAKKKKAEADDGGGDGFMMMFVTLSLILLAFFILLNSMAVIDSNRKRVALGSLLGSFGLLPGASSTDSSRDVKMNAEGIIGGEGTLEVFDEAKKEVSRLQAMPDVSEGDAKISLNETTGEINVILADRLLFHAGAAVISVMLFPLLEKIAEIAKRSGGEVKVTGHTDDRPLRGKQSNWQLSIERGTIVARHLESIGPLAFGKIYVSGASHYQPRTSNDTEEGRAKNRRVEVLIKTKAVE
ncbi:MAG: OmpA family protein [Myxococcota bacterium]|nr:OmpA family protein [Myxococcota bacterium]